MADLYMVGNAHLDPVWLWRWQEGFVEIRATFRSALDRMKEFPDFKFASACAVYYEWIEKIDPEMFEEIKQRVAEGRWGVVGGWFLQADCNAPSGESFARHALISQRYFKEKFGITAKTGYNVDSFGHNGSLPQILKKSGIDNYVFMRPMDYEKDLGYNVFKWESDDGSRVNAFRIPMTYAMQLWEIDKLDKIKAMADEQNVNYMAFYGVGNHGGGPTIEMLKAIESSDMTGKRFATPDEYFADLDTDGLPILHDELQHHARGCYSACSFVKKNNRICENNLVLAEKFSVMAKELAGVPYPAKKLKKAWKNVLFNHFHDIMGGCSIKKAYEDAGYLYGETMSITEQIINFAMQSITKNIDTLQGVALPSAKIEKSHRAWEHEIVGVPVIVFNPHSWTVKQIVQMTSRATKMTDWDGNEIPFQTVRGRQTNGDDKYDTAFTVEIAPYGYAVYRLFEKQESTAEKVNNLKVDNYSIENDLVKVEFDRITGDICRFYDKKQDKYIIDKPCKAVLIDDSHCDTWAHNQDYLGSVIGAFDSPEFTVTEEGPVRATLRIKTSYKNSVLQRDYTLAADSDVLTVKMVADFHEKLRVLKLCFPMSKDSVIAKNAFGTIERKENLGEEHCGSWIACGSLAVANDSKYGYDTENGEMRLSALRSAIYADHYGQAHRDDFCEYMEQGISEFTYSVFPFKNKADAEKRAEELNVGVRAITDSFHTGKLGGRMSCFECDNDNIVVTAVKQREDSEENIIRFYDVNGVDSHSDIKIFGRNISSDVAHNEIKTFDFGGKELMLTEWNINE